MTVKLLIFVQNAPVSIMKRAFAAPAYGSHRGMMNKALIPYMTAPPVLMLIQASLLLRPPSCEGFVNPSSRRLHFKQPNDMIHLCKTIPSAKEI